MAETVKPLIVLGEALSTGLPTSPALEIPGVTNITSETLDYGYQKSQDIEDATGNIVSTILSNFGITLSFTGALAANANPPYKGQAVTLSIEDAEGTTIKFPTAHISAVSVAYTSSGQAVVTGTVTGYAKLTAPVVPTV